MAPTLNKTVVDAVNTTVKMTVMVTYDQADKTGVQIIVACAALSLISVIVLLGLLGYSYWQHRSESTNHFFVRSHAAPYFICLLLSVFIQVLGSLMSSRWVTDNGIHIGGFCSSQGAIKNAGNLGVSLWTLVLGVYTFIVLFLRWNPRDYAMYTTILGVWFFIGFLVVIGPAAVQKSHHGPYYSIAGLWCWIADPYPAQKIFLEYFWMLGSAFASFILYTLTFLRLRGNIYVESSRMKFRKIDSKNSWKYLAGRDVIDVELTRVAKGMIGFPVLFTILIFPIGICRFVEWSGNHVSLVPNVFGSALFNLSGVFYLILFITTRSLLPETGFFASSKVAPRPKVTPSMIENDGVQPYVIADFSSAHGFSEMYQAEAEKGMTEVPQRTQASLNPGPPQIPPIDTSFAQGRYTEHAASVQNTISAVTPAWDDIDLGRHVQPVDDDWRRDNLSRRPNSMEGPETGFSLSAYGSDEGEAEIKVADHRHIEVPGGHGARDARYH